MSKNKIPVLGFTEICDKAFMYLDFITEKAEETLITDDVQRKFNLEYYKIFYDLKERNIEKYSRKIDCAKNITAIEEAGNFVRPNDVTPLGLTVQALKDLVLRINTPDNNLIFITFLANQFHKMEFAELENILHPNDIIKMLTTISLQEFTFPIREFLEANYYDLEISSEVFPNTPQEQPTSWIATVDDLEENIQQLSAGSTDTPEDAIRTLMDGGISREEAWCVFQLRLDDYYEAEKSASAPQASYPASSSSYSASALHSRDSKVDVNYATMEQCIGIAEGNLEIASTI